MREPAQTRIEIGAVEGSWRPRPRPLVLEIVGGASARRVTLDGRPLRKVLGKALGGAGEAWAVAADGTVRVRLPDRAEAFTVTLAR